MRMFQMIVGLCAAALAGCTTTCRISSNASGAKVYLDNTLVGVAPCDVELNDSTSSYTLKLEHPSFRPWIYMISQQYAGTVQSQQQTTTVNATTNAYGSGNYATSNTAGTVNQNTQTQAFAVYAWPPAYFVTMQPLPESTQTPAAQTASTQTQQPTGTTQTGQRGAFCQNCGARFGDGAQFCAGCGARRVH